MAARTATFSYRATKLARRNRGKLAIAAAVVVALSAAAAAERARERFEEVRLLANSLRSTMRSATWPARRTRTRSW